MVGVLHLPEASGLLLQVNKVPRTYVTAGCNNVLWYHNVLWYRNCCLAARSSDIVTQVMAIHARASHCTLMAPHLTQTKELTELLWELGTSILVWCVIALYHTSLEPVYIKLYWRPGAHA